MQLEILQQVRQLAQVRPPNTNAMAVISKEQKRKVVITNILICNTTGSAATWDLYLDKDGTTYSEATALFFNSSLATNTTTLVEFDLGLPIDPQAAGNLAVKVGTANAITFTVNGIEI